MAQCLNGQAELTRGSASPNMADSCQCFHTKAIWIITHRFHFFSSGTGRKNFSKNDKNNYEAGFFSWQVENWSTQFLKVILTNQVAEISFFRTWPKFTLVRDQLLSGYPILVTFRFNLTDMRKMILTLKLYTLRYFLVTTSTLIGI